MVAGNVERAKVHVVASFDPRMFDPRIIAVTGPLQSWRRLRAPMVRATARRRQATGYVIDHTAAVFLLDGEYKYVGALTLADSASARQEQLRRWLLP
jgi:cytochrome oxidase Cu insertion factor (SCO1/SenC/PrrC family)